jgi:RimJ/RimL family protein N-acetyltransferase
MSFVPLHVMTGDVFLRPALPADVDAIHGLFGVPAVYRYLADGTAPPRSESEAWVAASTIGDAAVGLWLLCRNGGRLDGCVRLAALAEPRVAELTYLLHPRAWRQGLATRMGWTVVQRAFASGRIDTIIAGADMPNIASIAVMRRLGMQFLREVEYPLGAGVEYCLQRDDPLPDPLPQTISLRAQPPAREQAAEQ